MKKILFIILAVIMMAVTLPAMGADKGKASIKFEEKTFNFGNIRENGGTVSHEFQFTNTGDANLVIIDAKAQCGCTKPEYPLNPVAPGKKSKIKVTFNPYAQVGTFEKMITIRTNGNPGKVRLKITGTVLPK